MTARRTPRKAPQRAAGAARPTAGATANATARPREPEPRTRVFTYGTLMAGEPRRS